MAERFDVATETIRRDLDALSANGLIIREFGGASARPMDGLPNLADRQSSAVAGISDIGRLAADLVKPGDVVMIDAGSTVAQLGPYLGLNGGIWGGIRRILITNCYAVVQGMGDVSDRDDVVMCPGQFDPRENAVYGSDTIDFLRRFHANIAFIGASGISSDGFSDANRRAVAVKRAMMERADATWLMVDHGKFNHCALESIAPLDALTGIITDQLPPANFISQLRDADIKLMTAQGQ